MEQVKKLLKDAEENRYNGMGWEKTFKEIELLMIERIAKALEAIRREAA